MPKARPPSDRVPPAPLSPAEAAYINQTVRRFYGADAVIRNYGPDPKRLHLWKEIQAYGFPDHGLGSNGEDGRTWRRLECRRPLRHLLASTSSPREHTETRS